MLNYFYSLDKSSKKYKCPKCGQKRFVLYLDRENNEPIGPDFGKCDRLDTCNYHCPPPKNQNTNTNKQYYKKVEPSKVFFFDTEIYNKLLSPERYENNVFINNLLYNVPYTFDIKDVTKVVEMYLLGTVANGYLDTAVTFPFFDIKKNLRYVQIRKFNSENKGIATNTLSSLLIKDYQAKNKELPKWLDDYERQDKKMTCLFGEHLLHDFQKNPVLLFESPKTSIIATLYFGLPYSKKDETTPICLAVGSKGNFTKDRLNVLSNRNTTVYADLSIDSKTILEWQNKTKMFGFNFNFDTYLESIATENDKLNGLDYADFLLDSDWRILREIPNNIILQADIQLVSDIQTEIQAFEKYFKSIDLDLIESIALSNSETVPKNNVKLCIDSHLDALKTNKDNKTYRIYHERLLLIKQNIESGLNR